MTKEIVLFGEAESILAILEKSTNILKRSQFPIKGKQALLKSLRNG